MMTTIDPIKNQQDRIKDILWLDFGFIWYNYCLNKNNFLKILYNLQMECQTKPNSNHNTFFFIRPPNYRTSNE